MSDRLLRYGMMATAFAIIMPVSAALFGLHRQVSSYPVLTGIMCFLVLATCATVAYVIPRMTGASIEAQPSDGVPAIEGRDGTVASRIVDASPLALITIDLQGHVTTWNKAAEHLFGWSQEEVMGRLIPAIPDEGKQQFDALVARARKGETLRGIELVRRRRDGSSVDVAVWLAPTRNSWGRVTGVLAEVMDITEGRRIRIELEHSRANLERAHRVAALASWESDLFTGQAEWSDETFQIFGVPRANIRPCLESYLAFVHPEDRPRVAAARANAVQKRQPFQCEHRIVRPDGTVRHIRQCAELVAGRDGTYSKLAGIIQDITEYKSLQEQLWQAQKLETVGRLAGGIAHDFNNLLTVVNGYSELLLRRTTTDAVMRQGLSEILAAGERAVEMTRKLLAFSRKQMIELRPVDLNGVVREMESILARLIGAEITLIVDLDPTLRDVQADPVQVQQIFLNTAVNARDAMPEGGTLRIETANVQNPADLPHAIGATGREYVLLSISDTGTGMTADAKEHLFEPFFTTKEPGKGTGLGLSTVYGIVRQTQGHISVDTAPGSGTTLHIYLPAIEHAAPLRVEAPAVPHQQVRARILLADHNAEVREFAAATLRELGYEVTEAKNGPAALELARRYNGSMDLVITDVAVPGMNGFELAREIEKLNDSVSFIFVSAKVSVSDHAAVQELRGGLLPKPFGPEALAKAVREKLGDQSRPVRS